MENNSAVILIGSNHPDSRSLIAAAVELLSPALTAMRTSSVVKSGDAAGGIAMYDNLVCVGCTSLSYNGLVENVKDIERALGRTPHSKQIGIIEVDIDVVMWNGSVMRPGDASKPYFVVPYSQLY